MMQKARAFSQVRPTVRVAPNRATLVVTNSFKNKEGIDLSAVAKYAKHENDCGSAQVQIAQLSARVKQISAHLIKNKKDVHAKRGLDLILQERKKLMKYVYRQDKELFTKLAAEFTIRGVVVLDTRGSGKGDRVEK